MGAGNGGNDVWFCHVYNKKKNEASPRTVPISQVPLLNPKEAFDESSITHKQGRRLNRDALKHDTFHMIRPNSEMASHEQQVRKGRKVEKQPRNAGRWFTHRDGEKTTQEQSIVMRNNIKIPTWMEHISKDDAEPEQFEAYTCVPPFCIADEADEEDAERKRRRRVKHSTMPPITVPRRFDKNGNRKRMVVVEHEDKGFAHLIANQYQEEWIEERQVAEKTKAETSKANIILRNKRSQATRNMLTT